ncbi:type II toxin-antitoxin system MqsA family antitoxin [Bradyrhizobium sp. I71]|uniref:type II toxin-antitoxin system MqsA family antitoxin n=1 Tax=Bradyrhizobium sp. I71 TaxID=2590772 RepID=UPI001EF85D29|nr:type II toxin-antitoxin system MqsA family antitoxin [Bradyrhizobium sp. I71]ULK98505.1 type II toxin-antitoxin system MqsA family antitoxin [Bradyrhizobium sp. I71]
MADELSSHDIRRIREKIGLSQVEAGELLGGGPRAFTKYENGTIKPAAATANILRLLDANPSALITLSGGKVAPIESEGARPFEVTGKHISALSPRKLVLLMRRLLDSEALSGDLPMDGIHVAANITAADGGEDARIQWQGGPIRTKFLPNRVSQFQLKAGRITPAEAGADVLTTAGDVKPMVRDALEQGGCYIMVCGQFYENKLIKARVESIRKALAKGGLAVGPERIQFRDADQIASWVNVLPPVAVWVLEQTQPGMVGPLKDWTHWAGRFDSLPWVIDPRLVSFRERLRSLVGRPRGVARVVGLSGVGKSRLVHEALGPSEEEGSVALLSDLVLYAVESEAGTVAIKSIVQTLVDSGFRAIVVVDRCPLGSHQDLAAMVKRTGSRISLVTIDHEVPPSVQGDDELLLVQQASDTVVEGMIKQIAPDLPGEDHRRLLKFARGFPQMAALLGQAWLKDMPIAAATNDELIDRILLGRKPFDAPLLKDAGMILGAFRLLGISSDLDDIAHVAPLTRGRSTEDLRAAFDDLQARGVVQRHGRLISLQPKPLAMALAERQWRQWGAPKWDEVLAGNLPERLRQNVARQLAMLNTVPVAPQVARHAARFDGPFASLEALATEGAAEVINALSEIDAEVVVSLLERILEPLSVKQTMNVSGDLRRSLVYALEKIAFIESTFERGALLLLKLAVAENEQWSNNSIGQFKALFPVFLSNTTAPPASRLRLFDELLRKNDPKQMPIVVEALVAAINMHSNSRMVGPEIHGSRPALEPWEPKYWNEAWDYVIACADRLVTLALRDDSVGAEARHGIAHQFRTYVEGNLLDHIERWVAKVRTVHPYWPTALNALGDVLQFDLSDLKPGEEARIRELIADLTPQDTASRVRFIVTEMPWDYPIDEQLDFQEREKRQVDTVRNLAKELLLQPDELSSLLGSLSESEQRMSVPFGQAIAELSEDPLFWETPIKDAYAAVPDGKRNYGLIAGFYTGLASRHPAAVEAFKRESVHSGVYAPILPFLCLRLGINAVDVLMVCAALQEGTLPPTAMSYWGMGGVFSKLDTRSAAALFDYLLVQEGIGYSVALDLLGMFVHGQSDRLEELRPQLLLAVDNVKNRTKRHGSQMDAHYFKEMVGWLLKKGRNDADARAAAGKLAAYLAADPDSNARDLIKPLLPIMLERFAPFVWPPFGNAIVRDRLTAWHIEHVLGDSSSFANKKQPAVLYVPEDLLFAWAHANPDAGPAFLARILPVLTTRTKGADFHPLMRRLLDEFGERDDVHRYLVQNMHSFGWTGSLTTYYAIYEEPLRSLFEHPIGAVRRWAQVTHAHMRKQVEAARNDDDEEDAQWNA